jgi:hypothetical protein
MKAASSAGRSPAKELANFCRSRSRNPSTGGRMGGRGPPCGKPAISVLTDSPVSGATGHVVEQRGQELLLLEATDEPGAACIGDRRRHGETSLSLRPRVADMGATLAAPRRPGQ